MNTSTIPTATVLTPVAIAALPAVAPAPGGASRRVLWQRGGAESGVLVVPAGCQLGRHRHRVNHHHIWVIDGTAMVLDQLVGPGSYVHVPSGVDHDIDARLTGGCTVFYVYEPPER